MEITGFVCVCVRTHADRTCITVAAVIKCVYFVGSAADRKESE